jgi:hypothetical protein
MNLIKMTPQQDKFKICPICGGKFNEDFFVKDKWEKLICKICSERDFKANINQKNFEKNFLASYGKGKTENMIKFCFFALFLIIFLNPIKSIVSWIGDAFLLFGIEKNYADIFSVILFGSLYILVSERITHYIVMKKRYRFSQEEE